MRTLMFLLQKEFRQIFRDPEIIRIILIVPIIQLLILPWAADYEVKRIELAVVDNDRSDYSRQLVAKITSSGYFKLVDFSSSHAGAMELMEQDKVDIILEIPGRFAKDLVKEDEASLMLNVNAVNGVKANLGSAYLRSIIQDFNREVRLRWIQFPRFSPELQIEVPSSNWFNPHLNYKFFMVPGILVILVTMVGAFLTALNIVKEKEIGTIEQINVTPIHKYHFMLGKLIPFWILGLFVLGIGLTLAWFIYGIVPAGSFLTIFAFAALYLLAVLGLGLLVSTYTATQQQAMLLAFFLMMIFILLGGLFTSTDSMPVWAQYIVKINPVAYFIEVMRMVILKGSSLYDIRYHMLAMLAFGIVLNSWAVLSYRKRA